MTEVKAPVRILQSGKVYRQMFDAEVQLMKSLDANKLRQSQTSLPKVTFPDIQVKGAEQSKSTITNASLTSSINLLTDRQKTWTEGMPNDAVTENPVLYRQLSTAAAHRLKASTVDEEVQEVHGLPNMVQVRKKSSNINERIAEKRKERHDKVLEDMYNDLCMVSNRTEPRITMIGENLQSQMKEDDIIIDRLFKSISSDAGLVNFSYERLEKIWNDVESHSARRREWIQNAHGWFNDIEDERLETISAIFKNYSFKLEKIAYYLKADIHRLIEKEAMMINQSVLANRRSYAKLHTNLLEGDIEREVDQHRTWNERLKDWRKLNAELAVTQFKEFMESDAVCDPPEVKTLMDRFLAEQNVLGNNRRTIFEQLKELKPPNSSKPMVYKWNTGLCKIHEDLDKLNAQMVKELHDRYECTCQLCLAEIEKYKHNLLTSKVCDEEDMRRIVNDHLLPLVGGQLKLFEQKLEEMDKYLDELAARSEEQVRNLFKSAQGAAHLWDLHNAGLAKQQRKLQDELEQAREGHDTSNQEREMKLDVTLDRLRQESTEDALNVYLDQCSVMLARIKEGYEGFHAEQLDRVANYPDMVTEELQRYEESLCKYFNVGKVPPRVPEEFVEQLKGPTDSAPAVMDNFNVSSTSTIQITERRSLPAYIDKRKRKSTKSKSGSTDSNTTTATTSSQLFREMLTTDKGTNFFILTSTSTLGDEDAKTKESQEEEPSYLENIPGYIKNVHVDSSSVKELKDSIRMNFLNHLEEWRDLTLRSAEDHSKDKVEELSSELDLRLHLHEPRSKRIEMDVRNVRAAELVLHRERVNRHCKGIGAALESLRQDFIKMAKVHDNDAAVFRSLVEKTESDYVKTTTSARLNISHTALHNNLERYVENVKTSLRDFRRILDTTLGKLREANAQCARSFKLFCEGGNFSPDETVPLRKKLEKISQRIDNAEGGVMRDLEGMESKRIEYGTELVNKLEEKYRNYLTDLTFIEAMQRWATNAQVVIKSEAAHSNGMAAEVGSHLPTLRRRVDACEKPNIDKETVTPKLLHSYSLAIMESLRKRAEYLDCSISDIIIEKSEDSDLELTAERPKTSDRVPGSVSRRSITQLGSRQSVDAQGVSQGRNRSFADDAAIGLIKTILRGPSEKTFSDIEEVRSTATGTTRAPPSANSAAATPSRPGRLQRQNTTTSSPTTPETPSSVKRSAVNEGVTVTYKRRDTKFDIKYMVFGAKASVGVDFKSKVKRILYDALDGMLSTAEIYYKQKGLRTPSRQQFIQESFDSCAEKVTEKLLKFEHQALDFHNNSLQDFRKLLHDLEYELCHVPRLLLDDLLRKELRAVEKGQSELETEFKKQEKNWAVQMKTNKIDLRPTLGHPDQGKVLQDLSGREKVRQGEHVAGIDKHACAMEECASEYASTFAERLSNLSNQLLKEFDGLITVDDVIVGRVPPRKVPTSVLVRRRGEGHEMSVVADPAFGVKPIIERGSNSWLAGDFSKLGITEAALPSQCTESVGTLHTTLPQAKVSSHRNAVLALYENSYQQTMQNIANAKAKRCQGGERWKANWDESVEHVKSLYKKT